MTLLSGAERKEQVVESRRRIDVYIAGSEDCEWVAGRIESHLEQIGVLAEVEW